MSTRSLPSTQQWLTTTASVARDDDAAAVIRGREVLRTLATWIILSAVVGVLTWWIVSQLWPGWQSANEPALLIAAEVYASLPIAMLLNLGGWSGMRDGLAFRFTSWRDIGLAIGVWLITLAGSTVVFVLLSPVLGSPQKVVETLVSNGTDVTRFPTATTADLVLSLVRALLLAGLSEELLYRGLLFGWLRGHLSKNPVILVTAVLFGLQHYYPPIMVLAFLYGLAAGWIRARTGSTLNTFVMHVLSDGLLLMIALLRVAA
jgi:membrane protease YdiL (CAAX protease family)